MILFYKIRPLFVQDGTSESLNLSNLSQYTGYCLRSTFYTIQLGWSGLWLMEGEHALLFDLVTSAVRCRDHYPFERSRASTSQKIGVIQDCMDYACSLTLGVVLPIKFQLIDLWPVISAAFASHLLSQIVCPLCVRLPGLIQGLSQSRRSPYFCA